MNLSRRAVTSLGVIGGNFLAAIEATIVAAAMPTVVGQLGGLDHYSWVFSAYLLTSTVTVPLWGKLSDLYGRRRFYMAAIGLFVIGSALSGASRSMGELIAFRAVQGIGAGGLLPLGLIILGDLYTLDERARMQGFFSSVWGFASIVGPLVGGYITDTLSWRWVFYLNLPFGIVAALLVGASLVEPKTHGRPRIDYRGAALMTAAVTVLLIALSQTGARDARLDLPTLVALYALALGLGFVFLRVERRAAEPIVPFDLLAGRLIGTVTLCGFLLGIAIFGAISFVPLFVQAALGGSATDAGTALTPLLLGWVAMSIVTGRVLPRVGFRALAVPGLALVSLGFFGLVAIGRGASFWLLRADLALMGVGMGMTMLTMILALQHGIARTRLGVATSFGQFTRSIGGAVGVALMGLVVAVSLPVGRAGPADMERALHGAFALGAVVSLAALITAFKIPPGRPATLGAPGQPLARPAPAD